ncbi:MAG: hypothetical protein AAF789_06830 [Bacteroidota bacterium]
MTNCSTLTKSQLRLSRNYFQTVSEFPAIYQTANRESAITRLESQNLKSALQITDSLRINMLLSSIDQFEGQLLLPDTIQNKILYIEKFCESFFVLMPNGFSFYKAMKGTTESLGGLVGVGGIISSILPNDIESVNRKRSKRIARHISTSQDGFFYALDQVKLYIDSVHLPRIQRIEETTKIDFEDLLSSIEEDKSPYLHYTQYNRVLSAFFKRLYLTKEILKNISGTMEPMKQAYLKMKRQTTERKKVNPNTAELTSLAKMNERIKSYLQLLEE